MKGGSRQGQSKVKEESSQGHGKVKVRLRQHKHNINLNYNLMGFDTIEINLVLSFLPGHTVNILMLSQGLPRLYTYS